MLLFKESAINNIAVKFLMYKTSMCDGMTIMISKESNSSDKKANVFSKSVFNALI